MSQTILFICTGNYYRSRFAEAVFNHRAEELGLAWKAFSRGLAIHLAPAEPPISEHTLERLTSLEIPLHHTAGRSASLTKEDLQQATMIVALQDTEHRPMIIEQFPTWLEKVVFWEVPDVGYMSPREALTLIEGRVKHLVAELDSGQGAA